MLAKAPATMTVGSTQTQITAAALEGQGTQVGVLLRELCTIDKQAAADAAADAVTLAQQKMVNRRIKTATGRGLISVSKIAAAMVVDLGAQGIYPSGIATKSPAAQIADVVRMIDPVGGRKRLATPLMA